MQLKYDFNINDIVCEKEYFSSIPSFILDYVKDYFYCKPLCLFDVDSGDNKFYCPRCFKEIDDYCSTCDIYYPNKTNLAFFDNEELDKGIDYKIGLYYFDISKTNVVLYDILLTFEIDYVNKKIKEVSNINNIYDINKKVIYDVKHDKYYDESNYKKFKYYNKYDIYDYERYVYDNLDELKDNETYKYSYLWKDDFVISSDSVSLESILINPIFYPQFEYLVKSGFYTIACDYIDKIEYKGNFMDTFGVSKDRINRFDKRELTINDIYALRYFDIRDRELLRFISNRISSDIFKDYLLHQKYNSKMLRKYMYYYGVCDTLCKHTLKYKQDKDSIYYPLDLDKCINNIASLIRESNPDIDSMISKTYKILSINNYEDDKYIIRPIMSLEDLLEEATMQNNCLASYYNDIGILEKEIYVMRSKDNINKSLVTIEISNNKLVQARERFNKDVRDEYLDIINKWVEGLLEIERC